MTTPIPDGRAALVGHTGFVGGNLLRQRPFDETFNSSNIGDIAGRAFDLVVCCGARAEKWKANAEPERDREHIEQLARAIGKARIRRLVLVSTVDVFAKPIDVDEESPTPLDGLHAYGRNRRHLEQLLSDRFATTVVRLPGLYGPGLKKNAIHDLLAGHEVHKIDSRGVFQFYNVSRLWSDLSAALNAELPLVHLPTEPASIAEVARGAFGMDFRNETGAAAARYDVQTRFASVFGGEPASRYIETKARELAGIAAFVAAERARQ